MVLFNIINTISLLLNARKQLHTDNCENALHTNTITNTKLIECKAHTTTNNLIFTLIDIVTVMLYLYYTFSMSGILCY